MSGVLGFIESWIEPYTSFRVLVWIFGAAFFFYDIVTTVLTIRDLDRSASRLDQEGLNVGRILRLQARLAALRVFSLRTVWHHKALAFQILVLAAAAGVLFRLQAAH